MIAKNLLEQLKGLDLNSSDSSDSGIAQTLRFLLNAVEELISENQQLREENQKLKDEINRLKGEQARPTIRPQKKTAMFLQRLNVLLRNQKVTDRKESH